MKSFLLILSTLFLSINLAWAACPQSHPVDCGKNCCPSGHFCCGEGCAPNGTNCCEQYSRYCPGNKPIACPALGKCFKNDDDARKAGCKKWIICGRPV